MPNKVTTFMDPVAVEHATVLGAKLSDTAAKVKDKVSDIGQTAADKIDENRDAAANGLDKAATSLHDKAETLPGGEKVTNLAHATADKLSTTANYIRDHDVKRMMGDVETVVKNNPGRSVLVAAAIGFLVGRAFSSND